VAGMLDKGVMELGVVDRRKPVETGAAKCE
jgi:hypothetical protein